MDSKRTITILVLAGIFLSAGIVYGQVDLDMIDPDGFFTEKKMNASQAHQGIAVDSNCFYPVATKTIAKYDRETGEQLASVSPEGIIHFDGAVVVNDTLYAAHSNWPGIPMKSSIEMYLASDLSSAGSIPLGEGHGSCVWIDRFDGFWWICYGHYNGNGGYPDIGNEATALVKYDDSFQELQLWYFPQEVIAKFGDMTCSGGSWGPDGLLYGSGHDLPEIYGMRVPESGDTLEYIKTVNVESHGQGIAWDRSQTSAPLLLTIIRADRDVVFNRHKEVTGVNRNDKILYKRPAPSFISAGASYALFSIGYPVHDAENDKLQIFSIDGRIIRTFLSVGSGND